MIVTGAGGDIGAAVARRFASQGARLALFDRKVDLLHSIVEDCLRVTPVVVALAADQSDREAVESAMSTVVTDLGGVDVLFANAGYGQFATFLEQSESAWRRHVDVNLTGTFNVCQVVAREMVKQGVGGSIIINASSGATQYTNLLSAYCVTKAGLAMLVKAMASELGPHHIRVNGVLPGVIETGMTSPMLDSGDDQRNYLLKNTPAGRLGLPEDIAGAVAFLASSDAGFVTGQSIGVDGGQTLVGQPQWFVTDYRNSNSSEWISAK